MKEQVRGNSLAVATEVKKLKTEKDLVWKHVGNKHQFDFNSDVEESFQQATWEVENNKF